jgi:NADPH:quinone reductase-like Zn-dependent oxidoreductase
MRAIWIRKHGGPEVLEVRSAEDPEPGPNEVRVRVAACGLNFAEISARQGIYPDAPKPPCVVGYEGAGVIDAIGSGVLGLPVGTRVLFMRQFGAHADCVCVGTDLVVPIAASMSFEHAAALPVAYLTAYHMLCRVARVRPGDSVLIHMAAGGVGTAALQLCRSIGGITVYGTCSASKHDYARSHGCDHPIDYRRLDYAAEVRRLTSGRGVDYVFDPLGGQDWKKGYGLLRESGMLVCYGMANAAQAGKRNLLRAARTLLAVPRFNAFKMLGENKAVAGLNLGHLWHRADLLRPELLELVRLYAEGKLVPHIDSTYPFEKAGEAHARIEHGKNLGKVLLVP